MTLVFYVYPKSSLRLLLPMAFVFGCSATKITYYWIHLELFGIRNPNPTRLCVILTLLSGAVVAVLLPMPIRFHINMRALWLSNISCFVLSDLAYIVLSTMAIGRLKMDLINKAQALLILCAGAL